jgi:molybdopterin-guanine dinucleotide biosynthesis protein
MASPDKFAFVYRWERELAPEEIARRYLADAAIVLCEGFKASTLPKIEVHRSVAHTAPLWSPKVANAKAWRGMVSDVAVNGFDGRRFDLTSEAWLDELAHWVEREMMR